MDEVDIWVDMVEPARESCERQGIEFPDPSKFLMEVATTEYGDIYVVAPDHSLHFFEHEEPQFFPCRASLDDLIRVCFTSPEAVSGPIELGWIDGGPPSVRLPPRENQGEAECLRERLPVLAIIALAVRCWRRGWPDDVARGFGERWVPHAKEVLKAVQRCEEVSTTGTRLVQGEAKKLLKNVQLAYHAWKGTGRGVSLRCNGWVASGMSETLVNVCIDLHDWEAIRGEPLDFENRLPDDDLREVYREAAAHDARYLLSLHLGEPGTVGGPVPASFFNRPLWPKT